MENNGKLKLDVLVRAKDTFEETLLEMEDLEERHHKAYRTAIIKQFEICFELSWKLMQKWIKGEEIELYSISYSKKDLFRLAYKHGLTEDAVSWFGYLDARNKASHTYDEKIAEVTYATAKKFHKDLCYFIKELEGRLCSM